MHNFWKNVQFTKFQGFERSHETLILLEGTGTYLHIVGGGGGWGDIFQGGEGARHFSRWKLNYAHNLTFLVKGVGTFSSSKEGEAKSKSATEFPEYLFKLLIAWSLTSGQVWWCTGTNTIVVLIHYQYDAMEVFL